MEWSEATVQQVKDAEARDAWWQRRLLFGARYLYLGYEQLLGPLRDSYMRHAVRFIGGVADEATSPFDRIPPEARLQQLHDAQCAPRIAQWAELRERLVGTRTRAACDALDGVEINRIN